MEGSSEAQTSKDTPIKDKASKKEGGEGTSSKSGPTDGFSMATDVVDSPIFRNDNFIRKNRGKHKEKVVETEQEKEIMGGVGARTRSSRSRSLERRSLSKERRGSDERADKEGDAEAGASKVAGRRKRRSGKEDQKKEVESGSKETCSKSSTRSKKPSGNGNRAEGEEEKENMAKEEEEDEEEEVVRRKRTKKNFAHKNAGTRLISGNGGLDVGSRFLVPALTSRLMAYDIAT